MFLMGRGTPDQCATQEPALDDLLVDNGGRSSIKSARSPTAVFTAGSPWASHLGRLSPQRPGASLKPLLAAAPLGFQMGLPRNLVTALAWADPPISIRPGHGGESNADPHGQEDATHLGNFDAPDGLAASPPNTE